MRTSIAATIFSLLSFAVPCALAESSHCFMSIVSPPGSTHVTIYATGIFDANQPSSSLNNAFSAYVRGTYKLLDPPVSINCEPLGSNPTIQQRAIRTEEGDWQSRGYEIVRVNWVPGQAAPAGPTTSQPAVPPPGTINDHNLTHSPNTTSDHNLTHSPATINDHNLSHPTTPPVAQPRAAAAAAAVPSPPAQDEAPTAKPSKAFHCIFTVRQKQQAMRYSSAAFESDATIESLNDAWKNYIRTAYHPADANGYGGCQALSAASTGRAQAITAQEQDWKRMGVEPIHVEWKSAPVK